jgi:biotin synthesis protein BioG
MDARPFAPLTSREFDVVNLYDFRELATGLLPSGIFTDYGERILIGWSMGVWAGQRLFAHCHQLFSRTIAINGTLCPIDNRYGIPRELFTGTREAWADLSRRKFYHRLCGGKEVEKCFLDHQPERTLLDQQAELAWYLEMSDCLEPKESIYREVAISADDRIVPTVNQLAYWGDEQVIRLTGGHFPFYRWSGWDELLEDQQSALHTRCIL